MVPITKELLSEAVSAFSFPGAVTSVSHYGEGHINDTFAVTLDNGTRFILQRINTDTFKDPQGLMENICGVTNFLRSTITKNGGNPLRETMQVIATKSGASFYADTQSGAWRVYTFVEDTVCLQKVESPKDFYTVAETFGTFQTMLASYPAASLHETIPHFHDTPSRYSNFEAAVEKDVMDRVKDVAAEIAFVRARAEDCHYLVDLLNANKLPLRVTHNDTKLNNVLIDRESGKGICVIDLDTVMPGLSLYDYGDSIRFGANDCAEDEPDQSKVHFSLPLFRTFTEGFLATAGSTLTQCEKDNLPWGAKMMTLECGMRFLTDYLEGDHYFKIHREGHNLDRARTQFTLVKNMEEHWNDLQTIILDCCK